MPKRKNKGFTFIEAFIAYIIISILWSMAQPNIHKTKRIFNRVQNECLRNQSALETAINLYNIDNLQKINNVYPGLDYEKCEKKLIDTKYLKNPIQPTYEGCSYGYIELNKHNIIFCKIHGYLKSSSPYNKLSILEYDKNLEKPFSSDYNNYRNKIIDEKTREKKLNDLEKDIINNLPLLMFFFLFFTALFCRILEKKQKKT